MNQKTLIKIGNMIIRIFDDNGKAIIKCTNPITQGFEYKLRSISNRYFNVSEVTKTVFNLLRTI